MRLKDRTLKNVYEQRVDREGDRQLTEAGLDPAKMQEYSNALEKLDNLVPEEATLFNKAIADAKQELNNYIQGGFKQVVKGFFGSDPVAKAVNFANAIRGGMVNIPTVAKGFLPKGSEKETQRSLMELVPQEQQQQLIAIVAKAFGNKLPYIANINAAVQEMLQNTNPQGLFRNAQQLAATPQIQPPPAQQPAAGAQAGQAAPTPNAASSGAPATGTTATTPATAAAPTQTTTGTAPSAPAQLATNKRLDAVTDTQKVNDIAYFLASQSGVDKKAAAKIIQALAKAKGLMDIQVPAQPAKTLAGSVPPAAQGAQPNGPGQRGS